MLKKEIAFEDLNGDLVNEIHYFHLSKAELVRMEMSETGGLSKHLEEVVASNDGKKIIETFEKLVLDAYGQKSEDGRTFIKNPELRAQFAASEAYSAIFMELVTDAGKAAEFVNGIVPRGLEQDVAKLGKLEGLPQVLDAPKGVRGGHPSDPAAKPAEPEVAVPAREDSPGVPRVLSMDEARAMPSEELHRLLSRGEAILGDSSGG
jgi:hypothetical protein